jgi:hypothetical protein
MDIDTIVGKPCQEHLASKALMPFASRKTPDSLGADLIAACSTCRRWCAIIYYHR